MKRHPTFSEYSVTTEGRVWSHKTNRWLKPSPFSNGKYLFVCPRKAGMTHHRMIHRLVLETFVGPCPAGMETCHLHNLRWGTRADNTQDRKKHGTFTQGTHHANCRLSARDVRLIIYICRTGEFTQKEGGVLYGIRQQKVSQIVNRKRHSSLWREAV